MPIQNQVQMAPKSLVKLLKYKPTKPLELDPVEKPVLEERSVAFAQPVPLPPVTDAQRERWAKARALQQTDERGQPAEGWAKRIAAMKADGRLVERAGAWYQRE